MKNMIYRIMAVFTVITIFVTSFPVMALAASFTIRRENIVSAYIQVDRGGGDWRNIEVREYRASNGNPAYCIQHDVTGPGTGGNDYNEMDPFSQLSEYQQKGLAAIMLHGYPYSTGGMSEEAGRYVTGLAIRCWLTETGDPNHTYYPYLDRINYPERMRSTGGPTVDFLDELLGYARAQDIMPPSVSATSMTFSRSTSEPQYYVAQTTISGENITSWSGDFSRVPTGVIIEGNDGVVGRTLTFKVPVSLAGQSVSFDVSGYSNRTMSNIFFLSSGSLQHLAMPDPPTQHIAANASASAKMPVGNLTIRKTNAETGAGLSGAVFNVSFSGQAQHFIDNGNGVYTFTASGGTTDIKSPASGTITVKNLPGGSYSISEKTAPSGFVGTGSQNATVTDGGNTTVVFQNKQTKVVISKTDRASGKPVQGVTLRLFQADGVTRIGDYTTNAQGKIEIRGLQPGKSYKYKEISAPEGFWFDKNKVYTFSINAQGNISGEISIDNVYTEVNVLKVDRVSSAPIEGVVIELYNPDGTKQGEYTTSAAGTITLKGLAPGTYTYKEKSADPQYTFDPDKEYKFTIDANGKVTGTTEFDNDITQIVFTKTDSKTGNALDGINFRIRKSTAIATPGDTAEPTETANTEPEIEYIKFTYDSGRHAFVYDENGTEEFTTQDGKAILERIPKGDYILEEVQEIEGFTYTEPIPFTLDDSTNTAAPLEISMENAPTRIDFVKTVGSTDETIDGFMFQIKFIGSDYTNPEDYPSGTGTREKITLVDGYVPIAWRDDTETWEYDPTSQNTIFKTKDGRAIIDYLPKGQYEIEEVAHDNTEFLAAKNLPFELNDTVNYYTPLELDFENWQASGTIRVYHRRVYTKEFLSDPYYLSRPINEDFAINPDAEVLKGFPIKMVEVYRTPRNLDIDKFPDMKPTASGEVQLIEDYHLMTADELAEWSISNAERTDEKGATFAGATDQKEIQTGQTIKVDDFEVAGTYDDKITTIVYWYEKEDIPLTINNKPDMDTTTYTIESDKIQPPKTGDTQNIAIYIIVAIIASAVIGMVAWKGIKKKKSNANIPPKV